MLRLTFGYWVAIFVTATALFFSLDLGSKHPEYRLRITPAPGQTGDVRIVFYGNDFNTNLKAGNIIVPTSGWQVIVGADNTVLSAKEAAKSIEIRAHNTTVTAGLVHSPIGGMVRLSNDIGYAEEIDLKSNSETVFPLVIGGATSRISPSENIVLYSMGEQATIALSILLLLIAIAWRMTRPNNREVCFPKRSEVILLALPFLITPGLTLIAFIPGNVSYDGSLQWVQAAQRGELFAPLGYPATYFMRLFTLGSNSPLPMIALQSAVAALSAAMVLHELRYRGVTFPVAITAAVIIAVTPQYFSFFTGLGKDALSLIAMLFFAWALLKMFRQRKTAQLSKGMVAILAVSGLFSGLMRANVLPIILLVVAVSLILIYWRQRNWWIIGIGVMTMVAAFFIPKILSDQALKEVHPYKHLEGRTRILGDGNLPLGTFVNLYIYHFFNAAISKGIHVTEEQARPFFDLMPEEKWNDFSCHMTDAIMAKLSKNISFTQNEYLRHLQTHQAAMANTVMHLALEHPGFALKRQACITEMLWYIGVGQKPFQTTATLGYGIIDERFTKLAGESRSQWPSFRKGIEKYQQWSENSNYFWIFWKPALPLIIGIFIAVLYLLINRDIGVALVLLLPILTIGFLLLVIPFPAYRYAYPAVLLAQLLCTLGFTPTTGK